MKLDSKADNIFALQHGLFGNAPQQWQRLGDVIEENEDGWYTPIVARPRVKGGRCIYDTTPMDIAVMHGKAILNMEDYYYNQPIDPSTVTLNAELARLHCGLHLFYSTARMHMRPSLREDPHVANGLVALEIVRHFACARGYAVIMELLDLYPDHVVEFTCMDKAYGTLGWNTVVWEVRNY